MQNIYIPDYHPPIRHDAALSRGGVTMYIHTSINYDERDDLKITMANVENLWIEVDGLVAMC